MSSLLPMLAMTPQTPTDVAPVIEYPDSDGQPMSDNTLQFRWIVTLQGNLDGMFRDDPNVFVAGDLLWYPVEGQPTIRLAPDALVAFGRPKGYRGSYMQWREEGVAPQVVFEVLSPGNTQEEMTRKLEFYDRYGVEEYYLYDPEGVRLQGWQRVGEHLQPIPRMAGWVSPRLQIRFDMSGEELVVYRPDGKRFLTFVELMELEEQARKQAEQEREAREQERLAREQAQQQAEQERQRAEQERLAKEQERQRAEQERLAKEQAQQQTEQDRLAKEQAQQQTEQERRRAEQERLAKEQAHQQIEQERRRAERLAQRLRALGLDPEA